MNTEDPSRTLLESTRSLRALAFALVRDPEAADDIVQDLWVSWLRRPRAELRSPRAWFSRAIRNVSFNHSRGAGRRARAEALGARAEPTTSAAEEAARADLARRLVDAVLALEEPYRGTLVARYFHGLEVRELALETRTPIATVRSREQRSLEMLRQRLDRGTDGREAWMTGLVGLLAEPAAAPVPWRAPRWYTTTMLVLATALAPWTAYRLWQVRELAQETELALANSKGGDGPTTTTTQLVAPELDTTTRQEIPASLPSREVAEEASSGRGLVVDTEGRTLAGVRLRFLPDEGGDAEASAIELRSDGDGGFELRSHEPSRVEASLAGYRLVRASRAAVERPEEPAWLVTLAATANVAVTVLDPAGRPLEGAVVELWHSERGEPRAGRSVLEVDVQTRRTVDAQGRCEFEDAWSGVRLGLFVHVQGSSFSANTRTGVLLDLDEVSSGVPIVVAPGGRLELEAHLAGRLHLSGEVELPDGSLASDYTIHVRDLGAPSAAPNVVLTSGAFTGPTYSLSILVPRLFGPIEVSAWKEGDSRELVNLAGRAEISYTLADLVASQEFQPQRDDEAVRIDLRLSALPIHTVVGRIVGADGMAPGKGCRLLVGQAGSQATDREPWDHVALDGTFLVSGLATGPCDLVVVGGTAPGILPTFHAFPDVPVDGPPVVLGLPRESAVRVAVRLAGTEARIVSVLVAACLPRARADSSLLRAPRQGTFDSTTDWPRTSQGSWDDAQGWKTARLVSVEPCDSLAFTLGDPGVFSVGIVARDREGSLFPVSTAFLEFAEGDHDLVFRPRPSGALSGHVLERDVQRASVAWLVDPAGRLQPFAPAEGERLEGMASLDAQGRFLLPVVPVGAYRLRVGTESDVLRDTWWRELSIEVLRGRNAPIEFEP